MGVVLPIIPVDCLPDHILSSGLELMEESICSFICRLPWDCLGASSPPVGGLDAPPPASSVRLVALGHDSLGGVGSDMGGVRVNVGAFASTMGGRSVPGKTSAMAVGALGRQPDPDKSLPALGQPHPSLGVPLFVDGGSQNPRQCGVF